MGTPATVSGCIQTSVVETKGKQDYKEQGLVCMQFCLFDISENCFRDYTLNTVKSLLNTQNTHPVQNQKICVFSLP